MLGFIELSKSTGSAINYTPLLIPVLFLLVYFEYKHTQEEGEEHHFKFESSVLNMAFGVIERLFDLYFFYGLFLFFTFVQSNFGLFEISNYSIGAWLLCMVLLDHIIYWYHRGGHRINFLWGAHVTHHQCEEFNLTVAFRNSVFPHVFRSVLMVILPILGFPAEMVIISLTISGLWQFLIHTTTVKKMGVLEKFMMTPSHHRVHHASNEVYIDKNFGGMFIIWDKLWGTFTSEVETVKYGITTPLNTWNPLTVYGHVWNDLYQASKASNSIFEKLRIWFGKPEDFYSKYPVGKPLPKPEKISRASTDYISAQLIVTIFLMLALLVFQAYLSITAQVVGVGFLVLSAASMCFIMDRNAYADQIEIGRIALLTAAPFFLPPMLGTLFLIMMPMLLIWYLTTKVKLVFYKESYSMMA